MTDTARDIMAKASDAGCTIHLPRDIVVAREFAEGAASETLPVDQCPADTMILDAGPDTVAAIKELFAGCRTLVWNGPLGAFEIAPFDIGHQRRSTGRGRVDRSRRADFGCRRGRYGRGAE